MAKTQLGKETPNRFFILMNDKHHQLNAYILIVMITFKINLELPNEIGEI